MDKKTLKNAKDRELEIIGDQLVRFTRQYSREEQTEEFLAEALGFLAENNGCSKQAVD